MCEQTDDTAKRAFEAFVGVPVTYQLASAAEIERELDRLYPDQSEDETPGARARPQSCR